MIKQAMEALPLALGRTRCEGHNQVYYDLLRLSPASGSADGFACSGFSLLGPVADASDDFLRSDESAEGIN